MADKAADGHVTLPVTIDREQWDWLRGVARETGQSEDALVAQAIQILRRISSYRCPADPGARPG